MLWWSDDHPSVRDSSRERKVRTRSPESVTGAASAGRAMPKRRVSAARIGDLRLLVGVGLVIASVVIGVAVMTPGGDTVLVLRATRDLSVGATPSGLVAVPVSRAAAGDAYVSKAPTSGEVLRWPVHAGELVPRAALAVQSARQQRQVTVAVDPLHAPVGLVAGDRVDVWASRTERDAGAPSLVVRDAAVASVSQDAVGVGGEIAVVLDLGEGDVPAVVAAVRSGVVDLVAIPVDSQTGDVTMGSVAS